MSKVDQLDDIQRKVFKVLQTRKRLGDGELHSHPTLRRYAGSTVRTRRKELQTLGIVRADGTTTNKRGNTVTAWTVGKRYR